MTPVSSGQELTGWRLGNASAGSIVGFSILKPWLGQLKVHLLNVCTTQSRGEQGSGTV